MKTFIRFVIFKGEVLAVFMRHCAGRRLDGNNEGTRTSYAHVGQHGECYDGMYRRKQATPEQYADLKAEMESIGYDLEVM